MKDFCAIIEILLRQTSLKNMEQLSEVMGIKPHNMRNYKSKNIIPYEKLFFFCRDNNINIMELLMLDGYIEEVRKKRSVEEELEKIALKGEVMYLKNLATNKDKKMKQTLKKALKKARFEIEFIINKNQPIEKEYISSKFLKRGLSA